MRFPRLRDIMSKSVVNKSEDRANVNLWPVKFSFSLSALFLPLLVFSNSKGRKKENQLLRENENGAKNVFPF